MLGSLLAGAVIAAVLVVFEDKYRHAALVASAAKSGGHQTVASILAAGFVGITLIVALVVFVLATVLAAPPPGPAGAPRPAWQGAPQTAAPRPRGRVAVTGHGDRYAAQDGRTAAHRRPGPQGPAARPGRIWIGLAPAPRSRCSR